MDCELTIPGDPDALAGARQTVLEFLQRQDCPEEIAFEAGMALQEALANAIVHGCKGDPRLRVRVRVTSDPSGVSMVIRDPGPGFDLEQVEDPASAHGRVAQSGRGILMMKSYMDEVSFADGGREVRMRKNCPRRHAHTA